MLGAIFFLHVEVDAKSIPSCDTDEEGGMLVGVDHVHRDS
jgi:hypothetical protein